MPAASLCTLADVAHRIPADCAIAGRLAQDPQALAAATVLWVRGDVHWLALHLDAPLADGSPLRHWRDAMLGPPDGAAWPSSPFLILIDGGLQIDGALTSDGTDTATHLIVTGDARMGDAVIGGPRVCIAGALQVDDLLWAHGGLPDRAGGPQIQGGMDACGGLDVRGSLQARVALFTDGCALRIDGDARAEFWRDEVRGARRPAECSNAMLLGAVLRAEFCSGVDAGEDGLAKAVDRPALVAALRAGGSAVHSSADIHAAWPVAHELCADNAISVPNILALVHTPVIAPKEREALGWMGQTDFSICQRHVDADGDPREDSVFITVWKTWDFYLSVQPVPPPQGLLQRLAAAVLRREVPTTPQLTLLYRRYSQGEAGTWQALAADADPAAWQACEAAWRDVLGYVRTAVGQHRARYPLHQRLVDTLTAERIESFTSLPVFTEQYNDWWDSERNGWWEGNVWVGARQPCMHNGEPWGRALKLSWKNGQDAPGDDEDNAHSAYQITVDEARTGPAAVEFSYAQRQSDSRAPLPRGAADHIARLLRLYGAMEARIRQRAG
ncbi:hypothetical protein [Paracidovorax sp. MALMAid1276]|uniref:hypothetical protein n=1 Tax=Paracidovorax sp. MALMAid1276 TaxID=3411631 RepID=UPI003B9968B5